MCSVDLNVLNVKSSIFLELRKNDATLTLPNEINCQLSAANRASA
jgi:hypothetical protein